MEVAGVVLAVVPIIIEGLKAYKQGKSLTDRVRNRKRHVAELIRALNGESPQSSMMLKCPYVACAIRSPSSESAMRFVGSQEELNVVLTSVDDRAFTQRPEPIYSLSHCFFRALDCHSGMFIRLSYC